MPTDRVSAYMRVSVNPYSNKRFSLLELGRPLIGELIGLFAFVYADPDPNADPQGRPD